MPQNKAARTRLEGDMRARVALLVIVASLSSGVTLPSRADGPITRDAVAFSVENPVTPGTTYTIRGTLVRPQAGCSRSVLLALHGLSYGAWAWDFPLRPESYSVAQALAGRGYALLAIDELGYNESAGAGAPDHPNGYTLSVEAYASMTMQIIEQLRAGTYQMSAPVSFARVGLIGHSAGSEIAELTAELYPQLVDVLIPTAYTHAPFINTDWLVREWISDNQRAAMSDYEYFETDPETRARDMYNLANADEDVVAWDTAHAALTPSGEIFSIGAQPSRFGAPSITMPVLLVLAEKDELFPASGGAGELSWFQGAQDKTLLVAPDDGHVFMLQRNAGETNQKIADWLDAHGAVLPTC